MKKSDTASGCILYFCWPAQEALTGTLLSAAHFHACTAQTSVVLRTLWFIFFKLNSSFFLCFCRNNERKKQQVSGINVLFVSTYLFYLFLLCRRSVSSTWRRLSPGCVVMTRPSPTSLSLFTSQTSGSALMPSKRWLTTRRPSQVGLKTRGLMKVKECHWLPCNLFFTPALWSKSYFLGFLLTVCTFNQLLPPNKYESQR